MGGLSDSRPELKRKAQINPIGSVSKTGKKGQSMATSKSVEANGWPDLKRFIKWAWKEFDLPILEMFLNATPTAELEPITGDYVQADEVDMGMTYDEREPPPASYCLLCIKTG